METTINNRVLEIKEYLKLTDIAFCTKAGFSTGTLFRIKKGEEISSKIIDTIVENFGVSREWLLHGVGELELSEIVRVEEASASENWKAKAFEAIRSKNEHLEKEVLFLRQLLTSLTSNSGSVNFQNDFSNAALLHEKCAKIVRVAA